MYDTSPLVKARQDDLLREAAQHRRARAGRTKKPVRRHANTGRRAARVALVLRRPGAQATPC